MEYLRRLLGHAILRRRLHLVLQAILPSGVAQRLIVRAAIATRLHAFSRRRAGYRRWIELFDELTPSDRQEIAQRLAAGGLPPINVVWAPGPEDRSEDVTRLVRSLQAQMLDGWTLTIVATERRETELMVDAVRSERKVRVQRLEEGKPHPDLPREHLLLLLSPGIFREHSLVTFALAAASGAAVAYCDTDRIDAGGTRSAPAFRPTFSPTLARQTNYFGPCLYLRDDAALAGIDVGNELQVSRSIADRDPATVMHLPHILFHQTVAREASIEAAEPDGTIRSVSIIIPTRDRVELLSQCIDSVHARSDYPEDKIEIIVVDNGSVEARTHDYLRGLASKPNVQIIRDDQSFNYSRLNNVAARRANGDILVLLNNDIVIDDARWLRRLVSYAAKADVGAVGGKLLYPDRTVQHCGVIFVSGARHAQVHLREDAPGYLRLAQVDREMAAVTAACLAIRRELFNALGGLDEKLAVSFNDATLCAEAQQRGYRNICIATPLAIHFESKSRGFDDTPEKVALARWELVYAIDRFRGLFRDDPFYNPNLSLDGANGIAFPPRVARPWRRFGRAAGRKLRVVLLGEARLAPEIESEMRAQALALVARGHEVVIGGAGSTLQEVGCRHVALRGVDHAAEFVVREGADCVVAHSWPFFAIASRIGAAAKIIAMDYAPQAQDDLRAHFGDEVIVEYNQFWRAWADRCVTVEKTAPDVVRLIEELCAN